MVPFTQTLQVHRLDLNNRPTVAIFTMAEISAPLAAVQVEALVVMKIIKHCSQAFPSTATGAIVGMDVDGTLEITNTFPFPVVEVPAESHFENAAPNPAAAAPRAKANAAYSAEMVRMLREVNTDANSVGWYTSANMGNFVNMNVIENQFYYQSQLNERTVALVHDVSRSAQGSLSLRAFRLSSKFMTAFKENKFTSEDLQKSNLRHPEIFEELPVKLHNSHLITSFIHQLQCPTSSASTEIPSSLAALESSPFSKNSTLTPNLDNLSLSIDPFLEKNCDLLLDSIETHNTEVNNYQYYQRVLGREQQKINAWKAKRAQENASRATLNQPLLPEDEWQRLFKLPAEPSRLESMLNTRQVDQYARQVDSFVSSSTGKMFAIKGNLLPNETSN
ncbi:Eukaryotic translation initiation factor 3 subunit EifCh, putative [Penicillium digitatum PHI26]|uniref:Eukaryotic translation initiation factor 3 subunit H n=3 Tax=Penicillium digitatum TaxID=36651 RepID=K9GD08_PEND2|nr:Eukaryotic translation initiation factor 3 subunit EifCh, putative [Penicillium digitatum Pd1]EKV12713.1 Eukaryotic translation initiation factor 3 subunit EifCh, putative [Penicillium digitatum PHI26]EKV21448.1 Eukaryotic translation initiation factor 3 subunit EifCh, putative [Penicillium digitatum Pd1]